MGARVAIDSGTVAAKRAVGGLRSPVSWALLGLVIQRPSYGYELVRRFERTHGDELELSSVSQIYTALDTLKRRGLIEELSPDGASAPVVRQPKPHYRATAGGLREHREWLVGQLREDRRRCRLFARQLAMLAPGDARAVIDSCERACLDEAARARPASGRDAAAEGPDPATEGPDLATCLVSEEERLAAGARLAWIEYARRRLTKLAAQPPGPESPSPESPGPESPSRSTRPAR